jgi:hypothetical protein
MPALRDDTGQAGAGDRGVAQQVLDDGERLAVLRARRRREIALRQERVDRSRGSIPDAPARRSVGSLWVVLTKAVLQPDDLAHQPAPPRSDFAGNVSSSRTSNVARRRS